MECERVGTCSFRLSYSATERKANSGSTPIEQVNRSINLHRSRARDFVFVISGEAISRVGASHGGTKEREKARYVPSPSLAIARSLFGRVRRSVRTN
jgi:hypothetical protein